jgi:hypothetical protein
MVNVTVRGLASIAGQLRRYNDEMNEALDRGTRNAASAIRNAVRAELRTPGTGREYPSRRGRAIRKLEREITTTKTEVETATSRRGETLYKRGLSARKSALLGAERRLQRALKKQGSRPDNQHRASEVGRAPAPDVGLLPQAVKAGKREGAYRVGVGGRWEGWEALHEGRGRQKGPRPFLLLGVQRIRDRLAGIWVRAVETRKRDA